MGERYGSLAEIQKEILKEIEVVTKGKKIEETLINNQFELVFVYFEDEKKCELVMETPSDEIFEFLKKDDGYSVDGVLNFYHDTIVKADVPGIVGLEKYFVCSGEQCFGEDKNYYEDEAD